MRELALVTPGRAIRSFDLCKAASLEGLRTGPPPHDLAQIIPDAKLLSATIVFEMSAQNNF